MTKTNVMRILDREKIPYDKYSYKLDDGLVDGISVARKINKSVEEVYKTLVGRGESQIYVFIIPVAQELDLKKAATITREKKIELVNVNDIMEISGYRRGGCSPIGMKKLYPTYIQEDSLQVGRIIISAGKIGSQIGIKPKDLAKYIKGEFVDIIK